MFRVNNFDKLLDKATSNLRLDPDWPTILQICDLIRQNDCSPKYAVAAVKKKLYSQNPHQAMFALLTLESIVKNCGSGVHEEVTSKAFCETLRDLVKTTQHENLKNKILELIQAWAFAFRNNPKYRAVQDTVNILKAENYKFPLLKESDAMFSADTAPEWADGEVCHRCRVAFSLIVRRHHCRACGQVFCQQCSSKTSTLPKFGIEKEVRVCDACFDKVSRPPPSTTKLEIVDTSNDYGPTQGQKRTSKSAEELQEEEELQLALALSQSEAEQKEKERKSRSHIALDPAPHHQTLSPTPSSVSASPEHSSTANAELSRYLDRSYWEQRLARDPSAAPTAPASQSTQDSQEEYTKPTSGKTQEDDNEDKEIDVFVESLKSQVEIFVNRMKSNSSRGRSIANDSSVQTLFMNITALHSQLLRYIQLQDDKRVYLESLQDKVSQVRDSRAALDTLRAEHAARLAAAAEAAERQRQMQMAAKLQAMRKKKHEYLQYQRQLALQRVQEQEREMQMRQEQQKHQYMMSSSGGYYMPGVGLHQFQPGYPNQAMFSKQQFHIPGMPQVTTDGTLSLTGQPAMSQAQMNVNQMGTISQSMPQLTNAYAMSTANMNPSTVSAQPSMNQPNVRPNIGQQLPMQHSTMHQMQLPVQMGMHQLLSQNVAANGLPGQNIPQQNGQSSQLSKQNLPNQPQQPQSLNMPQMSVNQQNISQPQLNPSNPILGMHLQTMRMPLMQGNQANMNQVSSGYPMNIPNQQNGPQSVSQASNLPQPTQMVMQGLHSQTSQAGTLPSHISSVNQNIQGQVPHSQGQLLQNQPPQMTTGQPMSLQGQHIPGQLNMQSQQILSQNQNIPQQALGQSQHTPSSLGVQPGQLGQHMGHSVPTQMQPGGPMQQIPQAPQIQGQLPQQLPQGPHSHMSQGQQMGQVQGQQMPQGHGQQIPQGQGHPMPQVQGQHTLQRQQVPQNMPEQAIKMQQQNFNNAPPQNPNQQAQQVQTPIKSNENNNNTAELISFD